MVNSTTWHAITSQAPPSKPPTAKEYKRAGYPRFDYCDAELKALEGSKTLATVKGVKEKGEGIRTAPLPENQSVSISNIVNLRASLKTNQVREGDPM